MHYDSATLYLRGMKYSVLRDPSGLVFRFLGELCAEDIRDANMDFHGDSRFKSLKYSIWDFSSSTLGAIQLGHMLTFVAEDYGGTFTVREHRLAIIVGDPHAKALMQFYIEKSVDCNSSWSFGLFETQEAAREWVDA